MPLILTALFTGLRTSELRGLTWAAIDLKAGELTVSQRLDRFGGWGVRSPRLASARCRCGRWW